MAVKLNLDRVAVRTVPQRLVMPLIRKTTSRIERRARSVVRVKSGAVRASIGSEITTTSTKVVGTVFAAHRRAMLEHNGSPRHTISQRPGGPVLTFYWPKVGSVVHFHSVNHPGTEGSKFLTGPLALIAGRAGFKVTIRAKGL